MRKLFVCIALGLTTLTGNAASPLWMRDVQIQHNHRMNAHRFGRRTVSKSLLPVTVMAILTFL